MTTAPSARNGNTYPDGPQLSSDDLYEYCLIVNLDWTGWAWRRPHGGTWQGINLAGVAGNTMGLPIDTSDTHYILAGCPDGNRRYHVSGNQHGDSIRYVIFPDHTADWTNAANWVNGDSWIDTSTTGDEGGVLIGQGFSYTTFSPLPDGTLLWAFTQTDRDTDPAYLGRDTMLFELAPGATTWTPGRGTTDGHFAICNETDNDGDPERAYIVGHIVGADGRIGKWGSWMVDYLDNHRQWFYYVEWLPGASSWTTIDGTPVTLPLTYNGVNATSTYSACQFTTTEEIGVSSMGCFDPATGYPHVMLQEQNPPFYTRHHFYWNGTAWVKDSPQASWGHLFPLKGEIWRTVRDSNLYVTARPASVNSPVRVSGDCAARFDPHPDPRRLWDGELAVSVPDGDTPRTFYFGRGPRVRNT